MKRRLSIFTSNFVIIHESGRLHKCIANSGSNKGETILFEGFAELLRYLCRSRKVLVDIRMIDDLFTIHEAPDIGIK